MNNNLLWIRRKTRSLISLVVTVDRSPFHSGVIIVGDNAEFEAIDFQTLIRDFVWSESPFSRMEDFQPFTEEMFKEK